MAKILVVEDSATVASQVELALLQEHHSVYVARDGLSTLAHVRAFQPDLILMDILLPHTSGFDLCVMLKRDPTHRSIPIVMMSSLNSEDDIQHAYNIGARDYITKPFGSEELITCVNKNLAQAAATRVRTDHQADHHQTLHNFL